MKATIKIQPEQLRQLINFVHGLTGKGVKVKQSGHSKIEIKDEEVLKFPKLNTDIPSFIEGRVFNDPENKMTIYGEGLRCHPNCVKGLIYNGDKTIAAKCDRCNNNTTEIPAPERSKEELNYKVNINQKNMHFGSASVIPNKQCIDDNRSYDYKKAVNDLIEKSKHTNWDDEKN